MPLRIHKTYPSEWISGNLEGKKWGEATWKGGDLPRKDERVSPSRLLFDVCQPAPDEVNHQTITDSLCLLWRNHCR